MQAGATSTDLMAQMGPTTARAEQIYLDTTSKRDRAMADTLEPGASRDLTGSSWPDGPTTTREESGEDGRKGSDPW